MGSVRRVRLLSTSFEVYVVVSQFETMHRMFKSKSTTGNFPAEKSSGSRIMRFMIVDGIIVFVAREYVPPLEPLVGASSSDVRRKNVERC
jgi:hypothetical protein